MIIWLVFVPAVAVLVVATLTMASKAGAGEVREVNEESEMEKGMKGEMGWESEKAGQGEEMRFRRGSGGVTVWSVE